MVTSAGFSMHSLAQIGLLLGRVLIAGVGFLFVYIALFLHEDEEGNLQNRLVELWATIYDLSKEAHSRNVLLAKESLALINRGLNSLFGEKLFSLRSLSGAIYFSLASLSVGLNLSFLNFDMAIRDSEIRGEDYIRAMIFPTITIILGILSITIQRKLWLYIWSSGSFIATILSTWGYMRGWSVDSPSKEIIIIILVVWAGILCDLAFLALNRYLIRIASQLNSIMHIIAMIMVNIFLAVAYISPAYWIRGHSVGFMEIPVGYVFFLLSSTNLVTAFWALLIIFLLLVAFLHRLFWPFIERPLYAITRHEIARKPILLLVPAILLLTWAIPAWKPFWEVLGKLK